MSNVDYLIDNFTADILFFSIEVIAQLSLSDFLLFFRILILYEIFVGLKIFSDHPGLIAQCTFSVQHIRS